MIKFNIPKYNFSKDKDGDTLITYGTGGELDHLNTITLDIFNHPLTYDSVSIDPSFGVTNDRIVELSSTFEITPDLYLRGLDDYLINHIKRDMIRNLITDFNLVEFRESLNPNTFNRVIECRLNVVRPT